jgi:nucleoside phosphorylase
VSDPKGSNWRKWDLHIHTPASFVQHYGNSSEETWEKFISDLERLLADGITTERIKQQHRQLLGIEMETYGVFAAAEEATDPRPIAFSMKSVVDFADANKDDCFQKYASFTSAQALKYFVENFL